MRLESLRLPKSALAFTFQLVLCSSFLGFDSNFKPKTEHIDNPKGYADGKDARQFHPKLRGPVDPRELEVDPRTGMKNYIANGTSFADDSISTKILNISPQHDRARES